MPFELLIIGFIVYSIYQKIMADKKKREKELARNQSIENDTISSESAETEWEQAMKELESIFTGEPAHKPQPEPVMEEVPERQPQKSYSVDQVELERQQKLAKRSVSTSTMDALLEEESNPIYRSSDDVYENEVAITRSGKYIDTLNNPDSIREAIVIKEILDRPKSLKRDKSIF